METRGKAHTAELKHLRETGLYQHQMMDGVWDWLGRHDEGVQRGLGMAQTTGGLMGVVAGAALAVTNPVGVALGAGVATLSAGAMWEGAQHAWGPHQSAEEGQRVLDALRPATFREERNPLREFGMDLATSVGMGVAGKLATGGARALRGVSFFGAEASGPSLNALSKRPAYTAEIDTSLLMGSTKQSFNSQGMTVSGRAVTKHPEYFGFSSTPELRAIYRTNAQLNEFAEQQIKDILKNGTRTSGGSNHSQGWVTYALPNEVAASWTASGKFIGFRRPPPQSRANYIPQDGKIASETVSKEFTRPNL